jgi:hypothetical protein
MVNLEDLALPIAVWKAVEGDRTELVALLRSDERINRPTRKALADWIEGKLKPVKLPKGHPPPSWFTLMMRRVNLMHLGHDPTTAQGFAGLRFARLRKYIRQRRWHLKAHRRYWSHQRLAEAIATKHNIDVNAFIDYLNRARKPPPFPSFPSRESGDAQHRLEIALKIRRKKRRTKNS